MRYLLAVVRRNNRKRLVLHVADGYLNRSHLRLALDRLSSRFCGWLIRSRGRNFGLIIPLEVTLGTCRRIELDAACYPSPIANL